MCVNLEIASRLALELMLFVTPYCSDSKAMIMSTGTAHYNVTWLDKTQFACGRCYFELGKRLLPIVETRENSGTVAVHNNWMVSYAGKVYRFKEHHMWHYDKGTVSNSSFALCSLASHEV